MNTRGQDTLYLVERVIKKRKKGEKTEYLIKWKGWSSKHNSWEPLENLHGCITLVEDFESRSKRAQTRKGLSGNSTRNEKGSETPESDDGRKVERILGATNTTSGPKFLIKWKDSNEHELVPNSFARQSFPLKVIEYYEKHLEWLE